MRMNAVQEPTVPTRKSRLNLISCTGQMENNEENYVTIEVTILISKLRTRWTFAEKKSLLRNSSNFDKA